MNSASAGAGTTATEIANIALANRNVAWATDGCAAFVWGVTNLAGLPHFTSLNSNKTTNNDPRLPQDVAYSVPHSPGIKTGTNDIAGDGWVNVFSGNPSVTQLLNGLRAGDVVRVYRAGLNNPNEDSFVGSTVAAHSFIVVSNNGAGDVQCVSNWANGGALIVQHSLSAITNTWTQNGFFAAAFVSRIDANYVASSVNQSTLAGNGFGNFSAITSTSDDYAATTGTTGAVTAGGSLVSGSIETAGDRDWFKLQVTQGTTYTINLVSGSTPQTAPFLADPEVYLYNSSSQLVSSDDDSGDGLNSRLTFTATYTGFYFIGAGEHGDNATGTYRLSVTAPTPTNRAPVATIDNHTLRINEWSQISSWISYSDPDGNAATQYQFYDDGTSFTSGYFSTSNNSHHPAESNITVTASNIGNVWIRGGAVGGSETMWVRAYDGTAWSAWDSFTLTTQSNTAPIATIDNRTVRANEWSAISSWISYSDANNDAATQYQFWDDGLGANSGYFWTSSNPRHAAGGAITVAASDLGNVWVRGGQAAGSETMWVRAFDGTSWSAWDSFTLTTQANTAPVATINNHTVRTNEWSAISSWISYSDANNDAATQYQFWDDGLGTNSGYFRTPSNARHAAGGAITVAASDIGDVWVRGGQTAGSETMWVRAFDGMNWGAWDSFTFTTQANTAPVATINNQSLTINQWAAVSNWLTFSDADNDAAAQYQFWDDGLGNNSGYFWTPNNPHHPAGGPITVAGAELGNVWMRGGQAAGSETMWVRAYDGTNWSSWDSFTLTTIV